MSKTRQINAAAIPEWVLWLVLAGGLVISPLLVYQFGKLGLTAMVGLAGGVLAVFTHPLVIFAVYFGLLFFKETTLPGMPISINQVVAPLFLLSAAAYYIRGRALAPRFTLLPLLAGVVAWFVITGLVGEDLENGLIYGRYAIIYLLLAVSVAIVLNSESKIYALSWVIVITTALAAAHGLFEALGKNLLAAGHFWGASRRVRGTAANSVVFGWNLLFAFPFAFFLFAQMKSNVTRMLALLLGLFIMAVATFTFNRQTYVFMFVVTALCAVLFSYKNRKILLVLITAMGVLGAFTVLPRVFVRMMTVTNLSKDYSFLERQDSWLMAMEMISKNPLMGVGFGAYSKVWRDYLPPDFTTYFAQYRHGSAEKFMDMGIMSITAETGFIGLGLFSVWIAVVLWYVWRRRQAAVAVGDVMLQNLSSAVLVTVIFFVLSSFIQDTFLYTRIWVLYGLVFLLDARHLPAVAARRDVDVTGAPLPEGT